MVVAEDVRLAGCVRSKKCSNCAEAVNMACGGEDRAVEIGGD